LLEENKCVNSNALFKKYYPKNVLSSTQLIDIAKN